MNKYSLLPKMPYSAASGKENQNIAFSLIIPSPLYLHGFVVDFSVFPSEETSAKIPQLSADVQKEAIEKKKTTHIDIGLGSRRLISHSTKMVTVSIKVAYSPIARLIQRIDTAFIRHT